MPAVSVEITQVRKTFGPTVALDSVSLRAYAGRRSAINRHLLKSLPQIIRETVKPMKPIESIKVLQVHGLPGRNSPSETGGSEPGKITDQRVNSAM